MDTYFLFGEEACRIYSDEGIDVLLAEVKARNIFYDVFGWSNGMNPIDLISAYDGWTAYAVILSSEFDALTKEE